MPIFNFKCEKCEKEEERIVKFSEVDKQVCPCDAEHKMIQIFDPGLNFILKGRWYKNSKGY